MTGFILLVTAIIVFFNLLRVLRKETVEFLGRKYRVVMRGQQAGKALEDERTGLRGRPDLLLLDGKRYVVVEYKTGRPRLSDRVQLYGYLYLVEAAKRKPCVGFLVYQGPGFERVRGPFELDERKRRLVEEGIELVREIKQGKVDPPGNTDECGGCAFGVGCRVRLTGRNSGSMGFGRRWERLRDEFEKGG